jgi:hypothetical protein
VLSTPVLTWIHYDSKNYVTTRDGERGATTQDLHH